MRTLAIDLGTRRVGLAMSDADGKLATPIEVLQITDAKQLIEPVRKLVRAEGVLRIVVGLPLNMDGTIGPAAKSAVQSGRELAAACGVPVVFIDERLSSFAAEQDLNDRKRAGEKLTRKRRKEQLDAIAAALFLQAFLDGKLAAIDV